MSIHFPNDELQLPWLSLLLDAYNITDRATRLVLEKDEIERGKQVACFSGCGICCQQPIPLTSLELSGIIWFIRRKMHDKQRLAIADSIKRFEGGTGCPLLINGRCSIYPLRPIACRNFNVYTRPCSRHEDVIECRPLDVMTPDKEMIQEAYRSVLTYYGFATKDQQDLALDTNYLFKMCSVFMHQVDWDALLIPSRKASGQSFVLPSDLPREHRASV